MGVGEYFICTFISPHSKQNRSKGNLMTELHYFRHSLFFRKYSSTCTRWGIRFPLHSQNNFSIEYIPFYTPVSKQIYIYTYIYTYLCVCVCVHISFILGISRTHGSRKFIQTIKYYYDFLDVAIVKELSSLFGSLFHGGPQKEGNYK